MVKKMIDINEYIIHINKSNIGNKQAVFKFPNGYGASLIQGPSSYGGEDGLFEIAVLEFNTGNGWELCYHTSVADDVLGHLTENEVMEILNKIYKLKKRIDNAIN